MFYRLKSAELEVNVEAVSMLSAVKTVFTSSDPSQRIFISHVTAYEYFWEPGRGEPMVYNFLCDVEVVHDSHC